MRGTRVIVAAVAAVLAIAVSSMAATGESRQNAPAAVTVRRSLGGASAGYARIAAVVQSGGAVVRSKGIKAVSHPSTGIYCLAVKDPTIKVKQLVPQATPEWGHSSGYDLNAQYYAAGADCPSRNIEIMTFNEPSAGTWDFSDSVGFTMIAT